MRPTTRAGLVVATALIALGGCNVFDDPRSDPPPLPAAAERLGTGPEATFRERCAACHGLARLGIEGERPLDPWSSPLVGTELAQWIVEPRSVRPDAMMPPSGLDRAEADVLAAWLVPPR